MQRAARAIAALVVVACSGETSTRLEVDDGGAYEPAMPEGDGGEPGAGGASVLGDGGRSDSLPRCAATCDSDDDCADCPALAVCSNGQCQPTCEVDRVVMLDSQENGTDVDALFGATRVEGRIVIGAYDRADLSVLACLREVIGDLVIGDKTVCAFGGCWSAPHPSIVTLGGLERLEVIDGDLTIAENPLLESIAALRGVQRIGNIFVSGNPLLSTLDGLQGITRASRLEITDSPVLVSLEGLNGLQEADGVTLARNSALVSLGALAQLRRVGDGLSVRENADLRDLRGLEALGFIGGSLDVSANGALESLGGLGSLAYVGSDLTIAFNPLLTDLSALGALGEIWERLTIYGNGSLTSLQSLAGVTELGGAFIENNPLLETLDGFPRASSLPLGLTIRNNAALTSLDGLEAVTRTGDLVIEGLPAVSSLVPLSGLTAIDGGSIRLVGSPTVTSLIPFSSIAGEVSDVHIEMTGIVALTGLGGISAINGSLELANNPALTSLAGLPSIPALAGLRLRENAALADLRALSSVTSTGALYIVQNDALTTLSGLEGLTRAIELVIESNASLASLTPLSNVSGDMLLLAIAGGILTDLRGLEGIRSAVHLSIGHSEDRDVGTTTLSSLAGLEGIVEVGTLRIAGNGALTSLTGLANMRTVRDYLSISDNPALTTLSELGITEYYGGSPIVVVRNASLPTCDAEAFALQLGTTCFGFDAVCTGICTCEGNDGVGTCL